MHATARVRFTSQPSSMLSLSASSSSSFSPPIKWTFPHLFQHQDIAVKLKGSFSLSYQLAPKFHTSNQTKTHLRGGSPTISFAEMLICCPVMKRWFSNNLSWVCRAFSSSQSGLLLRLVKKISMAILTCILALCGAAVGAITGAINGHTTETGLSRGFVIGAVAGAITTVQLMDLIQNGEPFSKVALMSSLVNGKIFMEWVSPAVLKAYQWQVSTLETSSEEMSDIFEVTTTKGLSKGTIEELPLYKIYNAETSCAICLQDLKDGENVRVLPSCRHFFHIHCADEWLSRRGSCPICRGHV